MSGELRS